MWFLKKAFMLIMLGLTACGHPRIVDMSVLPVTPTTVKIKQLAGKASTLNPSSCTVPCSVTIDGDYTYEMSFDAPGYYPAVIQFDSLMVSLAPYSSDYHTSLVIPLIQRKVDKDKVEGNPETPKQ